MQQIPRKTWNIRAMMTKLGNSTGKVLPHVDHKLLCLYIYIYNINFTTCVRNHFITLMQMTDMSHTVYMPMVLLVLTLMIRTTTSTMIYQTSTMF